MEFKLTIGLATPFFLRDILTLDALLSAAVFNATGAVGDECLAQIPLEAAPWPPMKIFRGSALFYGKGFRHVSFGRIMGLRTERDLSVDLYRPASRNGRYALFDNKRGDYQNNMSSYPGIESPEVFFWGVGDPERSAYLIENFIPGIGKRSNGGAGEIVSVTWEEVDSDRSWVTQDGRPARPLPADLWEHMGMQPEPAAPMAIDLPRWSAPKVPCVFPASLSV